VYGILKVLVCGTRQLSSYSVRIWLRRNKSVNNKDYAKRRLRYGWYGR
jgi:hypothetical protein